MDLGNSDACDGRAEQLSSLLIIVTGLILVFFVTKEMIFLFFWFSAGEEFAGAIYHWIDPFVILLIGILLAIFNDRFWVRVKGNKIQPAIDDILPRKLRDGTTRYIIFTTGFSIKLPWVSLQGDAIEIEKRRTKACDDFTVTVGGTSLEIKFKIAWKPHVEFLSTYLQNATTSDGEGNILDQLVAKTKQKLEESASRGNKTADEVRSDQSGLIRSVFEDIFSFGEFFGIEVLDISFSKCDFSDSVQKQMNRVKEANFTAQIRDELIKAGVEPGEAGRLAAAQSHVPNVMINEHNFGGVNQLAKILAEILKGKAS